jgi:uncharacterized protein (TIGR02145 family)
MKSTSGWYYNGNGTNSSGFSGLPGGYRYYDGPFSTIGDYGDWWSSTEDSAGSADGRNLHYYYYDLLYRHGDNKGYGLSVRCLRD